MQDDEKNRMRAAAEAKRQRDEKEAIKRMEKTKTNKTIWVQTKTFNTVVSFLQIIKSLQSLFNQHWSDSRAF